MKNSISLFLLVLGVQLYAQDFTKLDPNIDVGSVAMGDFDGDGDPDIFGIDYYFNAPSDIYWFRNNGGTPLAFETISLGNAFGARANPDVADYDGDGDMDILIAKGDSLELHVLKNDGTGVFEDVSLGVNGSFDLEFHDLESDGDLDIVGANSTNGVLNIYINNGSQSYTKVNLITSTFPQFKGFAADDLDNDGDVDIVAGYRMFISGLDMEVYKNNGDNTFTASTLAMDDFMNLSQVAIADMNKDGKLDIGAVNNEGFTGWINNGNLNFTRQLLADYPGTSVFGFLGVDLVDINGDGAPDPAMGDNDAFISWYKNTDTAPLAYEKRDVGQHASNTIKHADFDMDGDNDLIVANFGMAIFLNEVPQVSAVKEGQPVPMFEVFPNPSNGTVNVRSTTSGQYNYEIHDLQGTLVRTGKIQAGSLSLGPILAGTYIVTFIDEKTGQRHTEQVVKI